MFKQLTSVWAALSASVVDLEHIALVGDLKPADKEKLRRGCDEEATSGDEESDSDSEDEDSDGERPFPSQSSGCGRSWQKKTRSQRLCYRFCSERHWRELSISLRP
jgi:hypothetical protein